MKRNIEAVIISEDHYNALGVIRSLGMKGIAIHLVLTSSSCAYTSKSKYVKESYSVGHNPEEIIATIKTIVKNKSIIYALFPLSDFTAQIIDKCYKDFDSNVIAPNMNGRMLAESDKYTMKQKAEQFGFLTPKGVTIDLPNQNIAWDIFPAIIKPLVSVEGAKADIITVRNKEQLNIAIGSFVEKKYYRVLLEEFIEGQDEHMVEILGERTTKHGCVFSRIIQKKREYPLHNGSTSFAQFVNNHTGIQTGMLENLLNYYDFQGLFDIEFKYANENLYFIECNFRNGAPAWAVTMDGINIPMLWIDDNLDISREEFKIDQQGNVNTFIYEQNDILNMLKREVKLSVWMKDYIHAKKCFMYFKDIKPILFYYFLFIKSRLRFKRDTDA